MNLDDLVNRIGIKPSGNTILGRYAKMVYNSNGVNYLESLFPYKRKIVDASDKEKYYNEVYKTIPKWYTLEDVIRFANDQVHKPDWQSYNEALGLFISAAVNRIVENTKRKGEKIKIEWTLEGPIDNLFYKLKDCEVHINEAGGHLGENAERCEFYVGEAGDYAGRYAKDSKFTIKEAGDYLGDVSGGCEFYVEKAGRYAGKYAEDSKFTINKAGGWLGEKAERCEFDVEKAGNYAGDGAKDSKFTINKTGDFLGFGAKNCKFDVKEAGDDAGCLAEDSKFTINVAEDRLGYDAKRCKFDVKYRGWMIIRDRNTVVK
ncbi:MAG: hypothetical protein QXU98_03320 [Candidatus Parvarchaeota archaeon]